MGKLKGSPTATDEDLHEVLMLRANTLSTRLKLVIYAETPEKSRFPYLEGQTGVPTSTWRTWWSRGGVPSGLLLEAAAKLWPQYAFWLLTGRTDVRCGHDMPKLHAGAVGYISNWPEEATIRKKQINSAYSKEYLKTILELNGTETHNNAKANIKYQTLKLISEKRHEEITQNFQVKLCFEE